MNKIVTLALFIFLSAQQSFAGVGEFINKAFADEKDSLAAKVSIKYSNDGVNFVEEGQSLPTDGKLIYVRIGVKITASNYLLNTSNSIEKINIKLTCENGCKDFKIMNGNGKKAWVKYGHEGIYEYTVIAQNKDATQESRTILAFEQVKSGILCTEVIFDNPTLQAKYGVLKGSIIVK